MNQPVEHLDPYAQQRRDMIESQIKSRGVRDERVLQAMAAVPRELFVGPEESPLAYEDRALPIEHQQTISQPYIVAYMTAALGVSSEHRILEIGTGSGYQAAILSRLAGELHTVERIEALSHAAAQRLAKMRITNVRFHVSDGSRGWPDDAPFDRIIVTAAAPSIPTPLLEQLSDGGRIVIPVGAADRQVLTCLDKRDGRTIERPSIPCRFVKLLGQAAWEPTATFNPQ